MGADPRSARSAADRLATGRAGERAAADHLRRLGYRVLGQGFLARRGEIDLVCSLGGRLVMVEVKTRSSDRFGAPLEAVGARKRRALAAAAAEYRALAGWKGPIDYAVVSVLTDAGGNPRSVELLANPW